MVQSLMRDALAARFGLIWRESNSDRAPIGAP
jgi:hypothetical protein